MALLEACSVSLLAPESLPLILENRNCPSPSLGQSSEKSGCREGDVDTQKSHHPEQWPSRSQGCSFFPMAAMTTWQDGNPRADFPSTPSPNSEQVWTILQFAMSNFLLNSSNICFCTRVGSIMCDPCSHTGPCAQKAPLGLMPCCCHLEILNKFEQEATHLHFVLGPAN